VARFYLYPLASKKQLNLVLKAPKRQHCFASSSCSWSWSSIGQRPSPKRFLCKFADFSKVGSTI